MTEKNPKFTNALIRENSPYLLQHAHNPVDWLPWGKEALYRAKSEDKPLLISIGYSACHWCHVMERESFMDEDIAAFMNEKFICVKVDREERPDIDQIYMDAAQIITRSGGWPLNAFALPDGRPFYAGTYFPPDRWKNVLFQLSGLYENEREKVVQSAEVVTRGIRTADAIEVQVSENDFSEAFYANTYRGFKGMLDWSNGGFGGAPKFPLPAGLISLLKHSYFTENKKAGEFAHFTLEKMAMGGIYDQVGGGFSRYAVDNEWMVPHFEKMLYDNAQLLSAYSLAYRAEPKEEYKRVLGETTAFLEREMRHAEGGFFSALDADSEGVEGKFYVFSEPELKACLAPDEFELAKDYYQITRGGNWEKGVNILHRRGSDKSFCERRGLSERELDSRIAAVKEKLMRERQTRTRPGTDDKILSAWNGLLLVGLTDSFQATGEEKSLDLALELAEFLTEKMIDSDGQLYRVFKDGRISVPGFLDDYAFVIRGLIQLYQVSADERHLQSAKELSERALSDFFDPQTGMFFYTSSSSEALIARKIELLDNVIPSSNGAMGQNLYDLGRIYSKNDWVEKAGQMLENMRGKLESGGPYTASWTDLYAGFAFPSSEIVIAGEKAIEKARALGRYFLPNALILPSEKESDLEWMKGRYQKDRTFIYVCRGKHCKLPVERVEEAVLQIKSD